MAILSITIPTYNRAKLLLENLESLIPQIANNPDLEVLIFDNCSTDNTESIVLELIKKCTNIRYHKNTSNIGYVGNQINCIESANGKYIAFLCDDDIYIKGAVQKILSVVESKKNYSFIALNYYSFKDDYNKPHFKNYAPLIDKEFFRSYDIMNYPSVGHFSGYIFNSSIAKNTLKKLKLEYGDNLCKQFEIHRGIVSHLANLSLSKSNFPSYFIGDQILATRMPTEVDYDLLYHLNYNYLNYYYDLFLKGFINQNDYNYRIKIVLSNLPKAIFIESTVKNKFDYIILKEKFDQLLFRSFYYRIIIRPLFYLSQISLVKFLWKHFYKIYKQN